MTTKIIGHRGARGLALENTIETIQKAIEAGVDAIEIDIRATRDGQLILCHDPSLVRVGGTTDLVADTDYSDLRKTTLHNGEPPLLLLDALKVTAGRVPLIIEIRSTGCIEPLLKTLDTVPEAQVRIASFRLQELQQLKRLRPSLFVYGISSTNPVELIQNAKLFQFDGIGVNFWLLNPLLYAFARKRGMEMYTYTVNHPRIARLIARFYPHIWICTDYPQIVREAAEGLEPAA